MLPYMNDGEARGLHLLHNSFQLRSGQTVHNNQTSYINYLEDWIAYYQTENTRNEMYEMCPNDVTTVLLM